MRSRTLDFLVVALFFVASIAAFHSNVTVAQDDPDVPEPYQRFFVQYGDDRSAFEKALNLVELTTRDVGQSFALIAGVSHYPNMDITRRNLNPAKEDMQRLIDYLRRYEMFDEIVVLRDGDVTTENLEYFLQNYFPQRLRKSPKSRFLFAYTGHGMTEGSHGYILKSTARHLEDKLNSISLGVVRSWIDETIRSGHHVLVLLNSCYSGSFLRRSVSFGKPRRYLPMHPGAHAITAGGSGELAWQRPEIGKGSVFFEKVVAGLDKRADANDDGIVVVSELYAYLRREVSISTDQDQNPQFGDLTIHGSKGEFFFLNRDRQVTARIVAPFSPEKATPYGIRAEHAVDEAYLAYRSKDYKSAFPLFREAAELGNGEAMNFLGLSYEQGLGVERNTTQAVHWWRRGIKAGDMGAMHNFGYAYFMGYVCDRAQAELPTCPEGREAANYWFERAALEGSVETMKFLAWGYAGGGAEADKDLVKAQYWFEKAVAAGDIEAMLEFGDVLKWEKQYKKADHLYRRAVEAGETKGLTNLAVMYHYDVKEYETARFWYEKAIAAGNNGGMIGMGHLYESGNGVEKNIDEAIFWYRKAAEAGSPSGMQYLAQTYEISKRDYEKARFWYEELADAGQQSGMIGLAGLYLEGKGVSKDREKAIYWYRKAAEEDNVHAIIELRKLEEQQ